MHISHKYRIASIVCVHKEFYSPGKKEYADVVSYFVEKNSTFFPAILCEITVYSFINSCNPCDVNVFFVHRDICQFLPVEDT